MRPTSSSSTRRVHPLAIIGLALAGLVTVFAVPVLAGGSDDATPIATVPVIAEAVAATSSSTTSPEPTTTTTAPAPNPDEAFATWYAALPTEQKVAFDFLTMDDVEQAQWQAFAAPPTTTTTAPTAPVAAPTPPAPPAAAPAVSAGSVWDRLAQCEANGNWAINTGNGYSGGLQFHPRTWSSLGGGEFAPMAYQASREQQIVIAERVLAAQGWGAWPACTRKLGLR